MAEITRRAVLLGTAGAAGALTLAAVGGCGAPGTSGAPGTAVAVSGEAVRRAEAARRVVGQRTVSARLSPQVATIDLGGPRVQTWAYGQSLPGPLLRATAGDLMRVTVDNTLPAPTSVHWHGIALRNDMDGVPGLTQASIETSTSFAYEFTVPDPGTYFYHPHSGLQLDRGLHGALVVDDPHEPGRYDAEWVVVLDDWIDGTGTTPDDVLTNLTSHTARSPGGQSPDATDDTGSGTGGMGGMGGMGGGMGSTMRSPLLGGAGDIAYPHYLLNGRIPASPATLTGTAGQRVRIRLVNAGSDTAFRVALGGHQLTVTHSDGYPVQPTVTDALLIGMGERFDVLVTLADGAFPLVASAEGKNGHALAVVRTSAQAAPPTATTTPAELTRHVILGTDLRASDQARLPDRDTDTTHTLRLGGSMSGYRWTLNGATFPHVAPLDVSEGQRVRIRIQNATMMFHPMHIHGHTFALTDGAARKDTVIVRPMQQVDIALQADNPGQWATHCHNIYHAEAGMMATLSYRD